jgi:hypothetical protein
MAFERKDEDSATVLVKLRGNPLNYITSFKAQYLKKLNKDLGKGDAINYLLNQIPREVITKAIKEILEEHKKEKQDEKRQEKKSL